MSRYEFDGFSFEIEERNLSKDGRSVPLTPKAADLLLLFLENPGKLLSKDDIKLRVWPDSAYVEDNSLLFQVSTVRAALGRRAHGEAYIETLSKRGYRFVVPVEKSSLSDGDIDPPVPGPESDRAESQPATTDTLRAEQSNPRPVRLLGRYAVIGGLVLIALVTSLASLLAPIRNLRVARYVQLTRDTRENIGGPLLTDGARVYFAQMRPNGRMLAYVAVAGGETGIAFGTGDQSIQDLSPLKSEFLATPFFGDGGELQVIPLATGLHRRIEDLHASSASWSGDKQQIAFALKSELYIANADGSRVRRVASVQGDAFSPRWSPDQKKLCFTEFDRFQSQTWQSMWEVDVDGSNLHRLLEGWNIPPNEMCAGWTPDERFLVFQSTHDGRLDVWAMPKNRRFSRAEFGDPTLLTSGLEGYYSPLVSPDGKQIFAIGLAPRGELERYDSKLREFVPYLKGISAIWVSFSRSERSVAFVNYSDRTVWRQNLDGSEKKQITFSPLEAEGLSWSPDGKWFSMRARVPGKPWTIQLVPADGGEPRRIIPGEGEQAIPTWSRDSRFIAFGDVPQINGKASGKEVIHIMDISTGMMSEFPGSRGLWTARWSPDGRYLSALTVEGERIYLYDFSTRKWRSTMADHVKNSTWSKDGKYIYYDTDGLDRSLRRVVVADGRVEQLVSLREHPILDATWSGVAPDNSPLVLSDQGNAEIYSLILESH